MILEMKIYLFINAAEEESHNEILTDGEEDEQFGRLEIYTLLPGNILGFLFTSENQRIRKWLQLLTYCGNPRGTLVYTVSPFHSLRFKVLIVCDCFISLIDSLSN